MSSLTTSSPLLLAAWLIFGYLLGSIPFAWLIARWVTGKDLRALGSGNVGVMNTAISVARWAGLLVFLLEITKGALAAILPQITIPQYPAFVSSPAATSLSIAGVVAGTRWPVWLRFQGGRGNTAGFAALLFVSWQSLAILGAVWLLARRLFRNSFWATRVGILLMPVVVGLVTRSGWFLFASFALQLMFLEAQRQNKDDHLLLNQRWSSLWRFLTSRPRNSR